MLLKLHRWAGANRPKAHGLSIDLDAGKPVTVRLASTAPVWWETATHERFRPAQAERASSRDEPRPLGKECQVKEEYLPRLLDVQFRRNKNIDLRLYQHR